MQGAEVEWKTLGDVAIKTSSGGEINKVQLEDQKVMYRQVLDLEQHSVRNVTLGKKQNHNRIAFH